MVAGIVAGSADNRTDIAHAADFSAHSHATRMIGGAAEDAVLDHHALQTAAAGDDGAAVRTASSRQGAAHCDAADSGRTRRTSPELGAAAGDVTIDDHLTEACGRRDKAGLFPGSANELPTRTNWITREP